jgi:hypothetical protein
MAADDLLAAKRVSRREFLSAAALGTAYVVAGPAASLASAADESVSKENVEASEGVLRSFGQGTFEIESGGELRQVVALAGSTFWKGNETSWDGFSVGDDVLVRTVNGQLDRAWANLTRKRGLVVSSDGDRLTIALDKSGDDRLDVAVTPTTIFQNDFTGQRVWSELSLETSLTSSASRPKPASLRASSATACPGPTREPDRASHLSPLRKRAGHHRTSNTAPTRTTTLRPGLLAPQATGRAAPAIPRMTLSAPGPLRTSAAAAVRTDVPATV